MSHSKQVRDEADKLRVDFLVLAEDLDRYHTQCSIISGVGSGVAVCSGGFAIGAAVLAAPVAATIGTSVAVAGGVVSFGAHAANYVHDKKVLEKAESRLTSFRTSFQKLKNVVVNKNIPFTDVKAKCIKRLFLPIISEVIDQIFPTVSKFIAPCMKDTVSIQAIMIITVMTVSVSDLVFSSLEVWNRGNSKAGDELRGIADALKELMDELELLEKEETREEEIKRREELEKKLHEKAQENQRNLEKRLRMQMKREQMKQEKRMKEHAEKEKQELERQLQRAEEGKKELKLKAFKSLENALQSSNLDPESLGELMASFKSNMEMQERNSFYA